MNTVEIIDQLDWIDSATIEHLPFMAVLDQDIQSVQLAFGAYHAALDARPLESNRTAIAAHHGRVFVTAVHRVAEMLAVIQRNHAFAPAAKRLKFNLRKHRTLLAEYTHVRNVIEHANDDLPIFPDVALLMVYRDRVVLPIGVIASVRLKVVDVLLAIRRDIIEDLAQELRRTGVNARIVPKRPARAICVGCGTRHDLPFLVQPNHDADELSRVWVETPCPKCKRRPSELGVGGVGYPQHRENSAG